MASAPYLNCSSLSLTLGAKRLYRDLSFSVHPGERWGIVGPNGAGKSTLFKLFRGELKADSGTIAVRNGITVALVSQKFDFAPEITVWDYLRSQLPREFDADARSAELENEIAKHSDAASKNHALVQDDNWIKKMSQLQEELSNVSGISTSNLLESVLKLGRLSDESRRRVSELSGGQQKRLQILGALLKDPQLIFLDEPTNHLDIETVEWLEEFLLEVAEQGVSLFGLKPRHAITEQYSFVIISHDRALLDTLTNRILEIDSGESRFYVGNYESYVEQKLKIEAEQKKQAERMANMFRRELAWLRSGTKARTTKQTARIERAYALEKKLDEKKGEPKKQAALEFEAELVAMERDAEDAFVPVVRSLGTQSLINLNGVTLRHLADETRDIVQGFDLNLRAQSRIALLGPNGCGKSTLMRLAAGELNAASGTRVVHELAKISYFDQQRNKLEKNKTVLKSVAPEGDFVFYSGKYIHVMSYLDRFLFYKEDANRLVGELSGGEQARLLLAQMMLENSNVLILDEPTNDLDIPTLQVLEKNLVQFKGAVLFTSHDRYFIQRVATSIVAYLGETKKSTRVSGVWQSFVDLEQAIDAIDKHALPEKPQPKAAESVRSVTPAKKSKPTYKEQKEFESLEANIPQQEERLRALTEELDKAYASKRNHVETARIADEIAVRQKELEFSIKRWEELFEKISE